MTVVRASEGQLLQGINDRVCIKHPSQGSQNQMSVFTVEVPPGSFLPPHAHVQEEESYFMLKGSLNMTIAQENITLHPGDFVHIPQGTAHGYRNTSEENVQFLAWSLGGPIDHFFVEMSEQVKALPEDLPKMGQLLVKYGVVPTS